MNGEQPVTRRLTDFARVEELYRQRTAGPVLPDAVQSYVN